MRCEHVGCPSTKIRIYIMLGDEEPGLFALCPNCSFHRALELLQRRDPEGFMAYTNLADGQRRYGHWREYLQARQTFKQEYHADLICLSETCATLDRRIAEYYCSSGATLVLCHSCAITSERIMRDRGTPMSREYYAQVYTTLSHRPFDPL